MRSYRIYFRDPSGPVMGRTDFSAENDREAFRLAHVLWSSCSDVVSGYEIWCGKHLVSDDCLSGPLPTTLAQLSYENQERIIAYEHVISTSLWAISRSKRLLREIDELKLMSLIPR